MKKISQNNQMMVNKVASALSFKKIAKVKVAKCLNIYDNFKFII